MVDPLRPPSFATLLQRFFAEHLVQHRSVSPRTVAAYRDTFRLLLLFAKRRIGKPPATVALADLDAPLVLAFLDQLEAERGNSVRTRNVRLTAIRSFLGYAAHHDLTTLPIIERTLAIPVKRFDRPMLGFLSRDDMQAVLDTPDARSWAGQRDRALLTTMYNTGARVSEIIGVRLGDLVLDGAPPGRLRTPPAAPAPHTPASSAGRGPSRAPPAANAPPFPARRAPGAAPPRWRRGLWGRPRTGRLPADGAGRQA